MLWMLCGGFCLHTLQFNVSILASSFALQLLFSSFILEHTQHASAGSFKVDLQFDWLLLYGANLMLHNLLLLGEN